MQIERWPIKIVLVRYLYVVLNVFFKYFYIFIIFFSEEFRMSIYFCLHYKNRKSHVSHLKSLNRPFLFHISVYAKET